MKTLHHFYHVYADGDWLNILENHINYLIDYDIYNNLDTFQIGIVGNKNNIQQVKSFLFNKNIKYIICNEQESGFEQVTLNKLYEFSLINDGYVFYAHTKGATSDNHFWRRLMMYYNIVKWKECVNFLNENYDIVGAYWIKPNHLWEHADHDYFYAGNFWWANLNYIRKLNYPLNNHRYNAEGWIGLNETKKFYAFNYDLPVVREELNDNFWI